MEKVIDKEKFEKLYLDLRSLGLLRTRNELFEIMMNLTREHFKKDRNN